MLRSFWETVLTYKRSEPLLPYLKFLNLPPCLRRKLQDSEHEVGQGELPEALNHITADFLKLIGLSWSRLGVTGPLRSCLFPEGSIAERCTAVFVLQLHKIVRKMVASGLKPDEAPV